MPNIFGPQDQNMHTQSHEFKVQRHTTSYIIFETRLSPTEMGVIYVPKHILRQEFRDSDPDKVFTFITGKQ